MDKKFLLAAFSAASLTACLEVENNDELTEALQEQNQILQQQNDLLNQQIQNADKTSSITLSGEVYNPVTEQLVTSGLIRYKIAHEWSQDFELTEGKYSFTDLPANSSISLEVESLDDEFVSKTVHGRTSYVSGDVTYMEAPTIKTSQNITTLIKVVNGQGEDIKDVKFSINYANASSFNQVFINEDFTYDDALGGYPLVFPGYIEDDVQIVLLRDIDEDLDVDYEHLSYIGDRYSYSTRFSIAQLELAEFKVPLEKVVETEGTTESREIMASIAVLDQDLALIENAVIFSDEGEEPVQALFNDELNTYEITFNYDGSDVELYITDGKTEDGVYRGGTLKLSTNSNGLIRVLFSESSSHYYNYSYETSFTDLNRLDLTIKRTVYEELSELEDIDIQVVSTSTDVVNQSFKVLFNKPVEIVDDGVEFNLTNKIIAVKGNETEQDLVLPGTTTISRVSVDVDYEVISRFNNTLHEFKPKTVVNEYQSLKFDIEFVKDIATDSLGSVNMNYKTIQTKPQIKDELFAIEELYLDNNNYYHLGNLVQHTNTNGEAAIYSESDSGVYLYLPNTIGQLKNLYIKAISRVEDNNEYEEYDGWMYLVKSGDIYANTVTTISLAHNETIVGEYHSARYGTSLADGTYKVSGYLERMSDNTAANVNEMTFQYAYETLEGEIHTGEITLPVH